MTRIMTSRMKITTSETTKSEVTEELLKEVLLHSGLTRTYDQPHIPFMPNKQAQNRYMRPLLARPLLVNLESLGPRAMRWAIWVCSEDKSCWFGLKANRDDLVKRPVGYRTLAAQRLRKRERVRISAESTLLLEHHGEIGYFACICANTFMSNRTEERWCIANAAKFTSNEWKVGTLTWWCLLDDWRI